MAGAEDDKEVHAFLNCIGPKMNVIVQLEFEVAAQHVTHFTRSPPYLSIYLSISNKLHIRIVVLISGFLG